MEYISEKKINKFIEAVKEQKKMYRGKIPNNGLFVADLANSNETSTVFVDFFQKIGKTDEIGTKDFKESPKEACQKLFPLVQEFINSKTKSSLDGTFVIDFLRGHDDTVAIYYKKP